MGRLDGKTAIVTGAAGGIGAAIASMFAREGAAVALADVQDGGGQRTQQDIRAAMADARVRCQLCDVGNPDDVERLVRETEADFGPISVLVNNAASFRWGTVVEMPVEDWKMVQRSIVDGAFYGARFAVPSMERAGGGSIITIGSIQGFLASPNSAAYNTAKGAVLMLSKQLAVSYGPKEIRSNCICPGLIVAGDLQSRYESAPERARLEAEIYPLRRYGKPDEVACAALFLASDESSFITGQTLVVDGGQSAQLPEDVGYRLAEFAHSHADAMAHLALANFN